MKAVLPLALIGALAVGTAYAANMSSDNQSGMSGQSGMTSSSRQHMSQNEIKQIQSKLKQQGYDVGKVDGQLGPNTQQALRQFQEDKGMQATGQPDRETMAALNMGGRGGTQQGQLPQSNPNAGHPSGSMGGPPSGGSQMNQHNTTGGQ